MALSPYTESMKEWMSRGKTYEEAHEISTKGMEPSGYEDANGVKVPTGFKQSRSNFQDKLTPEQMIAKQQRKLLQAQKDARIKALQGQRGYAMTALEAEQAKVAPQFLEQRSNLKTSGEMAARRSNEALAARGLASSGASAQGDIARNVALQQGMTNIGEAEAGTLSDIAMRQTQAEQAYASGVAQAESEAAAAQAQAEIQALMQAQAAQQATVAEEAKRQFELEKMTQALANDKQLAELTIEADKAMAEGNFTRSKELEKYKNDLEAETIKLRASTSRSGGGGGSSSSTSAGLKLNSGQLSAAKAISSQIEANPGSLSSILSRITDPAVRAYLIEVYGSGSTGTTQNMGALSGYPTSRTIPGTTSTVPTWLNTRNLPGLG